ncbi:erythromycin esterase family protein [Brevundimonas sp. NPDC092305]|uniref:erythromycin esterase family protein n=1 Tax=Brevundimonas sp. NPDC092305 TaxID=3363957 RepID=UPI00380C9E86
MFRLTGVALGLCLSLIATSCSAVELSSWLSRHAIALESVEPGRGGRDLSALAALIGERRVVAVGEAAHGAHEIFAFKHRLFRYLVETAGFKVMAFEMSYAEGAAIDRYVQGGQGNPRALLASQRLWPWRTEEIVSLVEWMRFYNLSAPADRRLSFHGVDSGNGMALGLPILIRDFAERREDVGDLVALKDLVEGPAARDQERALALFDRIAARIDAPASTVTASERAHRLKLLRTARQNYEYYFVDIVYEVRDRHMADNLVALVDDREGGANKVFFWGHNAHVSRDSHHYRYLGDEIDWRKVKPAGAHLSARFGDDLFVIGSEFLSGDTLAPRRSADGQIASIEPFRVPPAPAGSLPAVLGAIESGSVIVPIRHPTEIIPLAMRTPIDADSYGGAMPGEERSLVPTVLSDSYDALVVLKTISPSHPLD